MPAILAIVFLGCTLISFLFTKTANVGAGDVIRDCTCVLLFLYAYSWRDKQRLQIALLRTITGIAIFTCAIGFFLFVSALFPRFTGPFESAPNVLAGFLLLAWPCAWITLRRNILLQTSSVGVLLGSLFLTQSRGAILICLLQIIAIPLLQGSSKKLRHVGWVAMFAVIFVTLALLVRSLNFPLPDITGRAVFADAAGTVPAAERMELMRQGFLASADRPIFGWGPGSFSFVGPHYQQTALANADGPHNIILRLAAERGWLAAITFAALCLCVLWKALRRGGAGASNIAIFLACAGVFLHAMMDRDLSFVGVSIPFWLLLGLLAKRTSEKFPLLKIAQCSVALTLIGFPVIHQSGDTYLSQAREYIDAGKPEEALTAILIYQRGNAEDARGWIMCAEARLMNGDAAAALQCADTAMRLGKFAYPGIAEHVVRIALATENLSILEDRMEIINGIISAFDQAIIENRNYAAESRVRTEIEDLKADLAYAKNYFLQLKSRRSHLQEH